MRRMHSGEKNWRGLDRSGRAVPILVHAACVSIPPPLLFLFLFLFFFVFFSGSLGAVSDLRGKLIMLGSWLGPSCSAGESDETCFACMYPDMRLRSREEEARGRLWRIENVIASQIVPEPSYGRANKE